MCGKDAPHHIFINIGSKCFIDLLCDPWAAKPWIALFHFNDCLVFVCYPLMNTVVDTYAA